MSASAAAPRPSMVAPATCARAHYTRVAVFGLLLLAAAPVMLLMITVASGNSLNEAGPLFAGGAALPLIAAGLVWRYGAWAKVVGIVITLAAAGALFWAVFGLAYPAAFGYFVSGVTFLLGVLVALGGNFAALVQGRRGHVVSITSPRERRVVTGAAVILALAVLVSGVMTFLARGAVADVDGTPVRMTDFAFARDTYTVAAGAPAMLAVHNSGAFVHNLAVPDLDVEPVTVLPGGDAVVELPAAAAGTHTIYCTLHSNVSVNDPAEAGMAATLVAR